MAHTSENSLRLEVHTTFISRMQQLEKMHDSDKTVLFLRLPANRSDQDAAASQEHFRQLANWSTRLTDQATVCILTTSPDAARLYPYLESSLRFQLWTAIKAELPQYDAEKGSLPEHHVALLILTRYKGSLRHTKTRIAYTYCPGCGKTTKDYGGKKHVYHEYGTLMSDVWRDIEIDPNNNIDGVADRLCDLFGIEPYKALEVLDLSQCEELLPRQKAKLVRDQPALFALPKTAIQTDSRLINDDCLNILKSLPDNSVDFCFADPPYNLDKKYEGYNDALELREYFDWCDQWLSELGRVLKPGRTCAILNIPLWSIRHYRHLSSILNYQNWIAWDALSLPARMIMPSHYSIVCFAKGEPRPLPGLSDIKRSSLEKESLLPLAEFFCLRANCLSQRRRKGISDETELTDLWHAIHRLKHNSRRVDHPCQLPPALMARLIALFTEPDEVVLDCFNGAGTTTLVAQQLGRRFIGMELSEQYHNAAMKRHEELSEGKDPFEKNNSTPTAKNSRVRRLPKKVYEVSKKTLQLDVKRIAQQLGRLPTREEVQKLSRYPIEYCDNYFVSWGEVCAAARTTGMSELPKDIEPVEKQLSLLTD